MKIRKFNSEGLERWRSFYRDLFMNIKSIAGGKISPQHIIDGYSTDFKKKYENLKKADKPENLSEELELSGELKIKKFKNSYELAFEVNKCLSSYKFYDIDVAEVWDWIAMTLFDQIFVPGKIRGASPWRYVTDKSEFASSFRHLIRGPSWAVNQYGENAKIFTCTKPYQQNDFLEQSIKISHIRENKAMAEVLMKLYYDFKADYSMEGTSKYPPNDQNKPGIFPRLRDKTYQFSRVKFLWGMNADQIIEMLPKEFNNYKKNITR